MTDVVEVWLDADFLEHMRAVNGLLWTLLDRFV